jgi:hypothetical protein
MSAAAPPETPRIEARFDHEHARRATIEALVAAGIPSTRIAELRRGWLRVSVAGRSDRYFAAETLRELGASPLRVIADDGH